MDTMDEATDSPTPTAVKPSAKPPEHEDLRAPKVTGRDPEAGRASVDRMSSERSARDALPEEKQDALEWFLAEDGEDVQVNYDLEINVSTTPGQPKWVMWTIQPIASDRIDFLRRQFQMPLNREQRRRGQTADLDASKFNAALVFESTVHPDLSVPLNQKGFSNGIDLILHRFRSKPLLVDQIAGQVLFYSGGDDEDVRAAKQVEAAGNS